MHHSISIASRRSGLSEHVIRAWEKRYKLPSSGRCQKGRRLYCEDDIERLRLLRELTERGHRIGQIAESCVDSLRELLANELSHQSATPAIQCVQKMREACHAAVAAHDAEALRSLLEHARREFGHRPALRMLVAPLIGEVGEQWRSGTISEAEEHLCSMVVRDFLTAQIPGSQVSRGAPELVASTPAGMMHELGVLLAATTARDLGWRVTYLGPSLPATEIARVATSRKARAVALSVVHPAGCEQIRGEIMQLRSALPKETPIIVGGRAAESYRKCLPRSKTIHWCGCLEGFENFLMSLV